ncbi:hypothetical protein niasHT_004844 [Heterodera trifolii]|uniref:Innexin n=1 Tax=Heterodera trifolii TaxID=157864 RepID=A0ABD2LUH9_9BILA
MFGIPFLSTYIQRVVKQQALADSVDWLNYYCSSILLAFFALAISAKQYFGQAINCWVPNEFKGSWEKYAEDYCFVANSYYVPFDMEVPSDLSKRVDQITYYRWVPVVLAIQALLFWLPNWLWNMLHKQTAINARSVVQEAGKSRALIGAERDKEIEALAGYISDSVSVFSEPYGRRPCGLNATLIYLAIKMLYVLNSFGQLIALNHFLGGQYYSWAYETFLSVLRGEEWRESAVFPRVIMCDFAVRLLANPQRHTIQCVIMMNMINEKLYFFLYFWFLFVGTVTLINFFYYLAMLMMPALRTSFVMRNINKHQQKMRGLGRAEIHQFVQYRLRPDGILLLHFLRQHIGGRVTYELLNELLRLYWMSSHQMSGSTLTTSKGTAVNTGTTNSKLSNASTSPPASEHTLLLARRKTFDAKCGDKMPSTEESFSRQATYKPTAYGPRSALMYPMNGDDGTHPATPEAALPQQLFNSATLLKALNGIGSPNSPGIAGNAYSMPPSLEYIDGAAAAATSPQNDENANKQLNATPLCQSRRAKSPLVTGLGSIGKRHHQFGNGMPNNSNSSQENNANSPCQLSTDSEV